MHTGVDTEKSQGLPSRELFNKQAAEREWQQRRRTDMPSDPMAECDVNQASAMLRSDAWIVDEFFRYHPPTLEQLPRYESINQAAKNFAAVILANCPPGADRATAIRMLRECRMTANAAIALNGLSL